MDSPRAEDPSLSRTERVFHSPLRLVQLRRAQIWKRRAKLIERLFLGEPPLEPAIVHAAIQLREKPQQFERPPPPLVAAVPVIAQVAAYYPQPGGKSGAS